MIIIRTNRIKSMGVYLYPFGFIRADLEGKELETTIRHERIHHEQAKELWVIGFGIAYLYFMIENFIAYRDWAHAYRMNPFELEAYMWEDDDRYLTRRPKHNYRQFL